MEPKERKDAKEKAKETRVKKTRKDPKEKATGNKAKEKDTLDSRQHPSKDITRATKENDKERQWAVAKERHQQQGATGVANQVTLHVTAKSQFTTYKRLTTSTDKTPHLSGTISTPMTTIGGQVTRHRSTQSSHNISHNSWHFHHHSN